MMTKAPGRGEVYFGARALAKLGGYGLYTTERSCSRGHNAPRFVANGNCSECEYENRRKAEERDRNWPELVERMIKRHELTVGGQGKDARSLARLLRVSEATAYRIVKGEVGGAEGVVIDAVLAGIVDVDELLKLKR